MAGVGFPAMGDFLPSDALCDPPLVCEAEWMIFSGFEDRTRAQLKSFLTFFVVRVDL
jgi:hypothetical protein